LIAAPEQDICRAAVVESVDVLVPRDLVHDAVVTLKVLRLDIFIGSIRISQGLFSDAMT
jgi:hypothetical protein